MGILPLAPWVRKTRKAILWVGFGWPIAAYIIAPGQKGSSIWAAIGVMFLATIFVPPSLVLSLLLPTYKSRIIAMPPLLVAVFWAISGQFSIPPFMLLWITTFTAIGLVIPEYSTLKFYFGRRSQVAPRHQPPAD